MRQLTNVRSLIIKAVWETGGWAHASFAGHEDSYTTSSGQPRTRAGCGKNPNEIKANRTLPLGKFGQRCRATTGWEELHVEVGGFHDLRTPSR